jgi:hypothetical protein
MGRNTEPRDRVELKPQPRHYRLGLSHDDHQSSPTAGHTSACYEARAMAHTRSLVPPATAHAQAGAE